MVELLVKLLVFSELLLLQLGLRWYLIVFFRFLHNGFFIYLALEILNCLIYFLLAVLLNHFLKWRLSLQSLKSI